MGNKGKLQKIVKIWVKISSRWNLFSVSKNIAGDSTEGFRSPGQNMNQILEKLSLVNWPKSMHYPNNN